MSTQAYKAEAAPESRGAAVHLTLSGFIDACTGAGANARTGSSTVWFWTMGLGTVTGALAGTCINTSSPHGLLP